MRILTVMSGVVLSATGAGCLAYYSNAFSSIAFVLGLVMIVSGIFLIGAFLLSSKNRLPDTVLVEGMMTLIFGFVILNNEVTDTVISMFFGAWLAVSGIIRFSQSLSVSRFDPKNWHKIMPLGIISAIFGFIMLMHSLISTWNQLTLVGLTFILNGFSQLVYTMYMVKHETLPQTEQARVRVEAKQKIAEEKRKERDILRSLGKDEREVKKIEIKCAQEAEAFAKKKASKEQKEKEKLDREVLLASTIGLSREEEAAIIEAAEQARTPIDVQGNESLSKEGKPVVTTDFITKQERMDEPIISWDSLSKEPAWEKALLQDDEVSKENKPVRNIMSFPDEEVSFVRPNKVDITEILEKEVDMPETTSFTPLILEDLLEEKEEEETPEKSKRKQKESKEKEEEKEKRFTEEFSWDWPAKD